jgi:hypothetical protein
VSDPRTLFRAAARAVPVTPAALVVDDDLARGRRALARRRLVRRTMAPTGLLAAGVAAAAVAVLAGQGTAGPSVPTGPVRAAPSGTAGIPSASAEWGGAVELVAYRGSQPAGYTISKVPEGWEVQNVDPYSLVIAPVGTADRDANSFVGKILVGKANAAEIAVDRKQASSLTVGKATGTVFTFDGVPTPDEPDLARGLLLPTGRGAYLIFQFPGSLHWDDATIADFAAGVRMTGKARAAAG